MLTRAPSMLTRERVNAGLMVALTWRHVNMGRPPMLTPTHLNVGPARVNADSCLNAAAGRVNPGVGSTWVDARQPEKPCQHLCDPC